MKTGEEEGLSWGFGSRRCLTTGENGHNLVQLSRLQGTSCQDEVMLIEERYVEVNSELNVLWDCAGQTDDTTLKLEPFVIVVWVAILDD